MAHADAGKPDSATNEWLPAVHVVMFARHGEKPGESGAPHGINAQGESDRHSLSVRGWTRAGALAALLAHAPMGSHPHVVRPQRILATAPTQETKSRREIDTAVPVGQRLGVPVEELHGLGDVDAARRSILADGRHTFVVWHHGSMAEFVRGFPIGNAEDVPHRWPEDRFDLIWVLRREANERTYVFSHVDQQLLAGDLGTIV